MKRRKLFATSVLIALILTTAAVLNAQGRGGGAGQSLAPPAFEDTVVVAAAGPSASFTIPATVAADFDSAIVDVQVLEPPSPFGRATTNFLTIDNGFGGFISVPLFWSRFGTSIKVVPSGFGTLAAGQEIRVRVWIHR